MARAQRTMSVSMNGGLTFLPTHAFAGIITHLQVVSDGNFDSIPCLVDVRVLLEAFQCRMALRVHIPTWILQNTRPIVYCNGSAKHNLRSFYTSLQKSVNLIGWSPSHDQTFYNLH